MEQNTEAWKKWRHNGIGASDANIIMCVSKYKKRSELLLEKQTAFEELKDFDAGPIAALGHLIEGMERPRFELLMDEKFFPALKQSEEVIFMKASYDGLNESETIAWEHKLMGKEMFEKVLSGVVPDQYMPQLQQQLFVTPSLDKIVLCCVLYNKEMLKNKLDSSQFVRAKIDVFRDENYLAKLIKECRKFWKEKNEKKDWSDLVKIARKRQRIKNLISKLEKKAKEIEPEITEAIKEVGELATPTFTFSYKKQSRESYDTKQMIEDKIDIFKYLKKSSFYVLRITEKGAKK